MIAEENTPKEYLGKKYTTYEALQAQRKMETRMRKTRQDIRLMQDGGADTQDIVLKKAKYQGQMQTYKAFAEAMDLPEQMERVYQDGLRGKFTPTKTELARVEKNVAKDQSEFVQYMSNSFRPRYGKEGQIPTGVANINVYKVENSEFDIVADTNNKRSMAVRLTEKNLRRIQKYLPEGFELPKIAVVDFKSNRLSPTAIGGYSESTGIMYINSKYDTNEKIFEFVNRSTGRFANTTELAPYLHELGHKYYYDCVKSLAKQHQISYNAAQKVIDYRVYRYIAAQKSENFLRENISQYADTQKVTEICAESFSVMKNNKIAEKIIELVSQEE